jgi:uncharacterized protein (UPF0210 family)
MGRARKEKNLKERKKKTNGIKNTAMYTARIIIMCCAILSSPFFFNKEK